MACAGDLESAAPERGVYASLSDPNREIRLFVLNHGFGDNEIQGELICVNMSEVHQSDRLTFEALSYAWGDPNDTIEIACRMSTNSPFSQVSVTKTLHAALRRFRLLAGPRLLWIDALCINQLDIPERNSQIKHMAEIYSAAKRVLVWLGESNISTDPFEAVDLYIEEMHNKRFSNVWSGFQNPPSKLVMEALPLFARPWFRRKWIIQEVLLAKEVVMHCGFFEHRFDTFQSFGYYGSSYNAFRPTQSIYTNTLEFQEMMYAATGLSNMLLIDQFRYGGIQRTLANLLMETRQFECTDPRDYVFSVLSIADDIEKDGIPSFQADYSLSLEDVVFNTTKWMIDRYGLDILSQTTGDQWSACFGQPQVCSSWSAGGLLQLVNKSRDDLLNPLTIPVSYRSLRTSEDLLPVPPYVEVTDIQRPNILHTSGKAIDRIDSIELSGLDDHVEPWVRQPFSLNNYRAVECTYIRNQLRRWQKLIDPMIMITITKEPVTVNDRMKQKEQLDKFGRLIFCDSLINYQSQDAQTLNYADLLSRYEDFLQYWKRNPSPPLWGAHVADDQLMEELDRTVRTKVITRIFCITKQGRFALLPPTAQDGDIIVLLNYAQSPYVLRPLPDNEYAMIGEAYVSGLTKQQMDDCLLEGCQRFKIR